MQPTRTEPYRTVPYHAVEKRHKHRCPTRLCAQPAALHAADPRMHCQVQLQPHHQVSATMMKCTTERKWHSWLNGVDQTTCPSMRVRKKEVVMDFRRNSGDHPPLTIDSSTVERVSSTKFLGVHIKEDLTWTTNTTSLSKKAQQRLHFLRQLKRASLPPPILTTFYRGTIESVLTSCITVWYGNCSAADRKTLQRTVNTAAKIIGAPLPSILDIFLARCSSKATSIVKDPTHPSHSFFQLLPSGRRFRSIRAHSARLLNSFFPTGCESPELKSPRPSLKPHTNPLPPETWTMDRGPVRHDVSFHCMYNPHVGMIIKLKLTWLDLYGCEHGIKIKTQLAITKQPTFMPTFCVISFYWWWICCVNCGV